MRRLGRLLPLSVLLLVLQAAQPLCADESRVRWQVWGGDLFQRARREERYVLLHMAAVWCHWCHVMERTTYRDDKVLEIIARKFLPVRVDQDAEPELSYRYEAWGWPATIMFDASGNEIFRRQGYLPPELFAKLLEAVIEDPSALEQSEIGSAPGPTASLAPAVRQRAEATYLAAADHDNGGFGSLHRFVHGPSIELALEAARPLRRNRNAAVYEAIARRTLAGARHLIDPVWGGMYQYSDTLDWRSPHYEKLLNIQRDAILAYVLAWQQRGETQNLRAAADVARWLLQHMRSPEGAFHTSQDADASATLTGRAFHALPDEARRSGPQPSIDRSLYARENGWTITALAALYDASGEAELLAAARAAMRWALENRRAPGGGFGHGGARETDTSLGDTLAMAEAALALYRSTAEREWLQLGVELARVIDRDHRHAAGGFVVRQPAHDAIGVLAIPVRQIDENVATVRLFNLLWRNTADAALRAAAEHGMRWLAAVAEEGHFVPGVLLADAELGREPAHITIVGGKDDAAASALYAAARRYPTRYLRLEWLDHREGPLPNPDVAYPDMPHAAAYACANGACSLPVLEPQDIAATAFRLENRAP